MWLKSNNINKQRAITLCYIEILRQVVFQIWFLYTALYWAKNNIHAQADSIQSRLGRFDSIKKKLTLDSYILSFYGDKAEVIAQLDYSAAVLKIVSHIFFKFLCVFWCCYSVIKPRIFPLVVVFFWVISIGYVSNTLLELWNNCTDQPLLK